MKIDMTIPPIYRRVRKKGDFNTPSVFLFLKKETAALTVIKTAVRQLHFGAHDDTAAKQRFFSFPLGGFYCLA